jgi:uncharacterized membrane protein YtjA (UPF0391 family)
MLGWAVGFFAAAIAAAVFGFGGVATTFTGIAVVLFWVFVALFVLSVLFGVLPRGEAGAGGGNAFALIALVAVIAIFTYAWIKNDMSAARVGSVIDRTTQQLADNTSSVLDHAGRSAQHVVNDTSNSIKRRTDANPHR